MENSEIVPAPVQTSDTHLLDNFNLTLTLVLGFLMGPDAHCYNGIPVCVKTSNLWPISHWEQNGQFRVILVFCRTKTDNAFFIVKLKVARLCRCHGQGMDA